MKKRNINELTKWKDFQKKLLQDSGVKREYDKLQPEFEIAKQLIEARIKKNMTQEEIAVKTGTGQAVISRLERANASPSLDLLKRLASALGKKLVISFK